MKIRIFEFNKMVGSWTAHINNELVYLPMSTIINFVNLQYDISFHIEISVQELEHFKEEWNAEEAMIQNIKELG